MRITTANSIQKCRNRLARAKVIADEFGVTTDTVYRNTLKPPMVSAANLYINEPTEKTAIYNGNRFIGFFIPADEAEIIKFLDDETGVGELKEPDAPEPKESIYANLSFSDG